MRLCFAGSLLILGFAMVPSLTQAQSATQLYVQAFQISGPTEPRQIAYGHNLARRFGDLVTQPFMLDAEVREMIRPGGKSVSSLSSEEKFTLVSRMVANLIEQRILVYPAFSDAFRRSPDQQELLKAVLLANIDQILELYVQVESFEALYNREFNQRKRGLGRAMLKLAGAAATVTTLAVGAGVGYLAGYPAEGCMVALLPAVGTGVALQGRLAILHYKAGRIASAYQKLAAGLAATQP